MKQPNNEMVSFGTGNKNERNKANSHAQVWFILTSAEQGWNWKLSPLPNPNLQPFLFPEYLLNFFLSAFIYAAPHVVQRKLLPNNAALEMSLLDV